MFGLCGVTRQGCGRSRPLPWGRGGPVTVHNHRQKDAFQQQKEDRGPGYWGPGWAEGWEPFQSDSEPTQGGKGCLLCACYQSCQAHSCWWPCSLAENTLTQHSLIQPIVIFSAGPCLWSFSAHYSEDICLQFPAAGPPALPPTCCVTSHQSGCFPCHPSFSPDPSQAQKAACVP